MTKTTYRIFRENNEHEIEEWFFYIPVKGNEHAIATLTATLDKGLEQYPDSFPYSINPLVLTEAEVDIVVGIDQGHGYLYRHNKLAGTLNIPTAWSVLDSDNDDLYEGGLTKVFGLEDASGPVRAARKGSE